MTTTTDGCIFDCGESGKECETKKSILVVDDDATFRRLFPLLLGEEQYDVKVVDGSEQALDALSRERFDVVVADYMMPGMDGLELARAVRERYPASFIILMTGCEAAELFRRSVADGFVQKPFSAEQLQEAISQAGKSHRFDTPS